MQDNISHGKQKKIALINDFTGFGRCSIAVQLPIISAMKLQCCAIPTALLSNHTGFESCYKRDLTGDLRDYAVQWKRLGLRFDAILTGYLCNVSQIDFAQEFIGTFADEDTIVVVDPVMGDNGRMYSGITDDICDAMRTLAMKSHVLTPNLTEACLLADVEYRDDMSFAEIRFVANKLLSLGVKRLVVTGISQGDSILNYAVKAGYSPRIIKSAKVGSDRSGAGDIFSAIIAAEAANAQPFYSSIIKASQFIGRCAKDSTEYDIPKTDGLMFENQLCTL